MQSSTFKVHGCPTKRPGAPPYLACDLRGVLLEEAKELRVLEVAVLVDLAEERLERALHLP